MKNTKQDTVTCTITFAKAHLSELLVKVEHGAEITIGRAGNPVAKLVKYKGKLSERRPGLLKKKIVIASDFDDLPDDILRAFGLNG